MKVSYFEHVSVLSKNFEMFLMMHIFNYIRSETCYNSKWKGIWSNLLSYLTNFLSDVVDKEYC